MTRTLILLLASAALAAAGCRPSGDRTEAREAGAAASGGTAQSGRVGDPVKPGANEVTPETLPANMADPSLPQDNEVPTGADPATSSRAVIPASYRGRWGLVPADCTSTRGDAKGLMIVGDRTLTFYESRGTLVEQLPAIATSLSGRFAFTGEGMNWERTITLERTGNQLRRTEEGGEEGPVDLTYTACPA